MTEQEQINEGIRELLQNQSLITQADIEILDNGVYRVKPDAMERVAKAYNISLEDGKEYSLSDVGRLLYEEKKRKEEATLDVSKPDATVTDPSITEDGSKPSSTPVDDEEDEFEKTDPIVEKIRNIVKDAKKNAPYFVNSLVARIMKECGAPKEITYEELGDALQQVHQEGLISQNVLETYVRLVNELQIARICNELGKQYENDDELTSKLSKELAITRLKYRLDMTTVRDGFRISNPGKTRELPMLWLECNEQISWMVGKFIADMYEGRGKYEGHSLRGSLFTKEVLKQFGYLNSDELFPIVSLILPEMEMKKFKAHVCLLREEKNLANTLIRHAEYKDSADTVMQDYVMKTLIETYGVEAVGATINHLKQSKLVLPYDDLERALASMYYKGQKQPRQSSPSEEESELDQDVDQQRKNRQSATNRRGKKKHKITKREKAISSLEKKSVISLMIAAAGCVSAATLVTVFGVNPIVAAKNCVASLASFAAANISLQQILPASKDFIKIVASVATSVAGTISWLRTNSAKKRLEEELEDEEEDLLEDPDRKERGRRR